MYDIFIYIIKWTVSLIVLYTPFTLLMRKETFSTFNRALLLCILTVSMFLPLIEVEIPIEVDTYVQERIIGVPDNQPLTANGNNIEQSGKEIVLWQILFIVYLTGVIISYARTLINIIKIRHAIHRGTLWHEECEKYTLHCHANKVVPFSWFGNIVISQEDYDNCKEIILHEEGHINGKHSWDILFTSILAPLQWFNPFIYMLINDLKDIHEYEADRYVLQRNSDAQAYQLLILKKAIGDVHFSLVNNFGRKSVRKRVEMMIRNRSGNAKLLKGLYLIPAAMTTTILFAKPLYIYSGENEEKTVTITDTKNEERNDTIKQENLLLPPKAKTKINSREINIKKEIVRDIAVINRTLPSEQENTTAEPDTTKTCIATDKKKIIYKNYPKNIIIDSAPTETYCDNYRCSVIMQFNIDTEGSVSNYSTKGCNVSIEGFRGDNKIGTISQLREYAIAAATKFIGENSQLFICKEDEDVLTNYTANLVLSSKEEEENSNLRDVLWIGTTPLK